MWIISFCLNFPEASYDFMRRDSHSRWVDGGASSFLCLSPLVVVGFELQAANEFAVHKNICGIAFLNLIVSSLCSLWELSAIIQEKLSSSSPCFILSCSRVNIIFWLKKWLSTKHGKTCLTFNLWDLEIIYIRKIFYDKKIFYVKNNFVRK